MAIGVIKVSYNQRQKITKIMYVLNGIQILLALVIIASTTFIYITIAPALYSEKPEVSFVFAVLGLYGILVAFVYLMGIKIAYKCLRQPHKKSTRGLLLLWICASFFILLNLMILSTLGRKIGRHISKSMKYSFRYGMHHYLRNDKWKQAIDNFQYNLACCGLDGYQDWHEIQWLNKYQVSESSDLAKKFSNLELKTYTVTPWSCCKVDFPMQCFHDPLQQPHSTDVWDNEPKVVQNSLNIDGCLGIIEKPIFAVLNLFAVITAFLFLNNLILFILGRILYTSCRNSLILNDPGGLAPGWIFGRGDCGYTRGKSIYDIMNTTEKFRFSKFGKKKKLSLVTTGADEPQSETEPFLSALEPEPEHFQTVVDVTSTGPEVSDADT